MGALLRAVRWGLVQAIRFRAPEPGLGVVGAWPSATRPDSPGGPLDRKPVSRDPVNERSTLSGFHVAGGDMGIQPCASSVLGFLESAALPGVPLPTLSHQVGPIDIGQVPNPAGGQPPTPPAGGDAPPARAREPRRAAIAPSRLGTCWEWDPRAALAAAGAPRRHELKTPGAPPGESWDALLVRVRGMRYEHGTRGKQLERALAAADAAPAPPADEMAGIAAVLAARDAWWRERLTSEEVRDAMGVALPWVGPQNTIAMIRAAIAHVLGSDGEAPTPEPAAPECDHAGIGLPGCGDCAPKVYQRAAQDAAVDYIAAGNAIASAAAYEQTARWCEQAAAKVET